MRIALVGGTVIDGNGGAPVRNGTVVIEDSKIISVGQGHDLASEVLCIDVSGKTVMPGLIDTHVHFAAWAQWQITKQNRPLSYYMAETALNMRRTLETGVTSARDLGGLEVGFCDAQALGMIPGPRTLTACVIIQATNGVLDNLPGVGGAITPQGLTVKLPGIPSPWADGVDGVRAKVRETLRYGAHLIKIANTSSPWKNPNRRPDRPLYTRQEVEAIVDEAHRAGVQVCCHVLAGNGTEATLDAIRAGVDFIDHGDVLDDECIEEMVKRNTWYCPMFSILDFHRARNPNPAVNPIAAKSFEQTQVSFRKATAAGVRICMGTDHGAETGWQGQEMQWMAENGLTPMQSIVVSTKRSAEAMRMDKLVGTLDVGKEADLLVVDGDPLQDLRILSDPRRLSLVMQAGKPVSGPLARDFPYQVPVHLSFMSQPPSKRSW